MKPIKAILFDADGTLMDTAPSIVAAINHVLQQHQRDPITIDDIRPIISYGGRAMMRKAFSIDDEAQEKLLSEQLIACYPQFITHQLTLFDGFIDVLQQLDQHQIPWGIVSNKPEVFLNPQMKHLELHERSHITIGGDTYKNKKPHPQPLLEACQILDLSPREVIYIGDCEHDVTAAKRANMRTCIVEFGYIPNDNSHRDWGAEHYVQHPTGLLPLLS